MSKLPKNLSTQELLEILETSEDINKYEKDNSDDLLSEVLLFISHFNLDKGEYKIHQKYIYKLYKCYSKNPVNSPSFLHKFSSIYAHKVNSSFFLVNKDIVNIIKLIDQYKTKRKIKNSVNPKLLNNVKGFLKDKGIQSGDYWVESFILTELYNDYRKRFKKPNYNAKLITSVLSLLFETVKTKHNKFVWIKINQKALDIFDEIRYTEYINTRGLEWWKNLPKEVATTEANERRKKAKDAIKHQNLKYKTHYKKKRLMAEKKKNIQH